MPQFRTKLPPVESKPPEWIEPSEDRGQSPGAPSVAPRVAPPGPEPVQPAIGASARASVASAQDRLRALRDRPRPFLHLPSISVPSWSAIESSARELLAGPVEATRPRAHNPRELSDSIAMGRAIWRDLVIGFASQLGELNLGFTQLAALYALADTGTMTISDMADTIGRSPSATSRLVDSLVERQLVERRQDSEDRRLRTLALTGRGQAVLGRVDRARAAEFLAIVRPLATPQRAVVAMGVAALASNSISKRGRLIKMPGPRGSAGASATGRPRVIG